MSKGSIASFLRIVLNQKNSAPKKYTSSILKERTAHLGSYNFLQEMLINIKTCHFHSSINYQEQFFHRTLITGYFHPVNIAKFLRTDFFIEHLQKQLIADIPQNRYS